MNLWVYGKHKKETYIQIKMEISLIRIPIIKLTSTNYHVS